MAESEQVIAEQLERKNIKRDVDVIELFVGERNLKDVASLTHFKNLRYLWLNGNNLRRITCLPKNFRLSELYLHDNELVDITGALCHLTSLEVLFLNNNQLEKLEKVIRELSKMQNLRVLNLFNNPVAQEPEYRMYVIHNLPSVELLDRREVLKCERDQSRQLYDQKTEAIKETIAFGRRSEGPPSLYYPGLTEELHRTVPTDVEVGNNFYRNNPEYATEDQAIKVRHLRRSIVEYSNFDWSKIPRSDTRRTAKQPFVTPQIITTRFR